MKYFIVYFLISYFCTMSAQTIDTLNHLGAPFTLTEVTPISDLINHPEKYYNRDVKIEGVIASMDMQEECFIEVVDKKGGGEGVLVNFPDCVFKFPTNCYGRIATVEGMFYQKIYPASRVLYWQSHSYRKGKHVPEFSLIKRITARGVDIRVEKVPVPESADIPETAVDIIDMNITEFETDGFGTGKKILLPGEITEEHSTGNTREIVFCLEGTLTITKGNRHPFTISAGEMSYIPPETKHTIMNKTGNNAVYIFVYSRQTEKDKTTDDH